MSVENQDQRMENVISNYLKMETSYALLINGRRGIGKTFFIKDRIIPRVKKTEVFHDASKKYKPIYISLYGLKSMDEVFTLMTIEFMPWLNSKGAKICLSIGKLVTRGLLNINKAGDVDTYLKDLTGTAKHAIDTKDFVIIFDDLDRIAKSLEIGEVVGFINSLVEHENNKILVIADEEQLANEAYLAVREKTIGTGYSVK
ncbi:P-loop NTPase fold protein [Mucilaginibacter sp. SG564]|uniref:P-loop NTPase fold protein n=1 Tax=Mucilaginibacter sp. SG564 TaxID=2587022 RepID=UPI001551ABA4|nr:P-loop NTPase fold protein [Mucilaginibacter sp. SG564]NOW94973.1 Cdc6-like AAA superfamily ATPase [Mucilaginibacter sp. SG564]